MDTKNIKELVDAQYSYFSLFKTLDISFRKEKLIQLKTSIKKNEQEIIAALNTDLGKSEFEAFSTEIGMVYSELTNQIKNIKKWAKPRRVSTPLFAFPATSSIHKQPFGRVLVISPFNYPFLLALSPVIAAISAGNVVVLKPSEYTPSTSAIIAKIITDTFKKNHVTVIQGGIEINKVLLALRWDKIFFTGSTNVGKIVLEAAAKNLTPVVLELGGKNPVIVDKDANLKVAARRIIWGKLINAGQTCIAPDYLYVHSNVKDKLLVLMKQVIEQFFTDKPHKNGDFPKIVNESAMKRLQSLLEGVTVYYGGKTDRSKKYFSPTILTNVNVDSVVMEDEIFGPILPVLTFDNIDEVVPLINRGEKPLAIYYFTENRKKYKEILSKTFSGDAGINEVIMHFTNHALPFGGVGYSGMGAYHGKRSFNLFSHERSVMKTTTRIDLPFRYPPYKKSVLKLVRALFR